MKKEKNAGQFEKDGWMGSETKMATMFNRKKETELWWIGVVAIAVLRVCTMNCFRLMHYMRRMMIH